MTRTNRQSDPPTGAMSTDLAAVEQAVSNMKKLNRALRDVEVAAVLGVSRVSVWRYARRFPDFPKPYRLSNGATRWREAEIEAWLASRRA